jgi:hypothetical protein
MHTKTSAMKAAQRFLDAFPLSIPPILQARLKAVLFNKERTAKQLYTLLNHIKNL